MSKLVWDQVGNRFYETGLDRGVLYLPNSIGIPWNGLTAVEEQFNNDITAPYFIDGVKYLDAQSTGDFAATLKALTYPDEFLECEGVISIANGLYADNQEPKSFNLSWRTRIGNDVDGDLGYKLHLLYNAIAVPSDNDYETVSETSSAMEFSWSLTSMPTDVVGYASTAYVVLDSRYLYSRLLPDVEAILYGDANNDATMPNLSDLIAWARDWKLISVVDNGDGTWTATGPDEFFTMLDANTFQITGIDATYLADGSYNITDTYEPQGG